MSPFFTGAQFLDGFDDNFSMYLSHNVSSTRECQRVCYSSSADAFVFSARKRSVPERVAERKSVLDEQLDLNNKIEKRCSTKRPSKHVQLRDQLRTLSSILVRCCGYRGV